jgi:hypothetical protein
MDLKACFEALDDSDEYLEFSRIIKPRSNRPDLHAFLLLDRLAPGNKDLISAAEHDVFFLDVDMEVLAANATEDDIRDLIRCGVRYDTDYDCLTMFA